MKTIDNGTLTIKNVGEVVTLYGWVQKKRDLGGVVFIDLRDRSGIVQIVVRDGSEFYDLAASLKSESVLKTQELIKSDVDIYAISVFANVYYPNEISKNNVKFILTVNGEDYPVKPVNSYENGIKIIRFSQGKMPAEYTKYIGEKIQSASLKIIINSEAKLTPYINNIKILLGGEI